MAELEDDRALQEDKVITEKVKYIQGSNSFEGGRHEIESPPDLSEAYCTYFFGDVAIGPVIAVWWFSEEEIYNLIEIENDTGMRVFPRYIYYHPLYESMSMFCWKYYLEEEFIDNIRRSHPALIAETDEVPWKKKVAKIFDFLSILTTSVKNPSGSDKDSVASMISELWKNFTKEYVQSLLSSLSDRFISKYIAGAQKTAFSYPSLFDLKTDYLKRLYDAVRYKHKRPQERRKALKEQCGEVREIEEQFPAFKEIVTQNYDMNQLKIETARRATIKRKKRVFLLLGETGAGKELFAEAIHEASGLIDRKKERPFLRLNVTSIPSTLFDSELFGYNKGAFTDAKEDKPGLFEQAKGGTILLDEIGELDITLQPKLLRVIEAQEFCRINSTKQIAIDCTIVLATNRDLSEDVEKGNFRRDLYMRINRIKLEIPPLRERKDDILPLVQHFIKKTAEELESPDLDSIGITEDGLEFLLKYEWPGNVRELLNIVSKIIEDRSYNKDRGDVTYSELLKVMPDIHLLNKFTPKSRKGRKKRPSDEELIRLENEGHNREEVAKKIGVVRETVSRWYSDIKNAI